MGGGWAEVGNGVRFGGGAVGEATYLWALVWPLQVLRSGSCLKLGRSVSREGGRLLDVNETRLQVLCGERPCFHVCDLGRGLGDTCRNSQRISGQIWGRGRARGSGAEEGGA